MQQFENILPVQKDRKFSYNILFTDSFDGLAEALRGIVPDFAAGTRDGAGNNVPAVQTSAGKKTSGTTAKSAVSGASNAHAFAYDKICILTDSNVGPLYRKPVEEALAGLGTEILTYTVEAGEDHKNLDTIRDIYRFLIEKHFDRHALLLALGGGVIGDMTGFAAATYLRGIDYVQVPTTLLSQADSSIGGKTGVDFEGYKNMVGAFKMPKLVYENVSTLKTLDGRQFVSGFAEVMKSALIADEEFYVWLIDNMYEITDREPAVLQEMLFDSCCVKKRFVEKDPYEVKERRLLNLGHTIGHAIEKYKNFTLTHGECVALGTVAAAFLSWKKNFLSMEEYYEIRDMFVPFGLPISVEDIDIDAVTELTHSDKKVLNGTIQFVLLKKIGKAFLSTDVTDDDIRMALKEVLWVEDGE